MSLILKTDAHDTRRQDKGGRRTEVVRFDEVRQDGRKGNNRAGRGLGNGRRAGDGTRCRELGAQAGRGDSGEVRADGRAVGKGVEPHGHILDAPASARRRKIL